MKKSKAFFIAVVFVLIAALNWVGTAEADDVPYIKYFYLYKTPPEERSANEQPISNETLALKPFSTVSLYMEIHYDEVFVPGTLIGNGTIKFVSSPTSVAVRTDFSMDHDDPGYPLSKNARLQISTEDTLPSDVLIPMQFTTSINYVDSSGTEREHSEPSESFSLRVGYDEDQGGGSCDVLGTGAMVFLLIPLAVFRGKARGRSLR